MFNPTEYTGDGGPGGTSANLLGACPPFQIDSKIGAPSGISEMQMQSHPYKAAHWRELRVRKILDMQSRHADGRMYADDEFTRYPAPEQMVFWMLSDVHLLQWLAYRQALSKKADWLVAEH